MSKSMKKRTLSLPKINFKDHPLREARVMVEYSFEFSSIDTNYDVFVSHFPTMSRARAAEYARIELMELGHVNPVIHV